MDFDLLTTVDQGGCSAKLPAGKLSELLAGLKVPQSDRLLVGIETHDDAGVYKLSDETALIQTVDFFPPMCSSPFDFGCIAAANALSDVYAMGGIPLTALNIVSFPVKRIPLEILRAILEGGIESVANAEAVIAGGHTIDDFPPKYGLAVTGIVHPDHIITNAMAQVGDMLILSKPLGTGIIIAGKKIGEAKTTDYQTALASMKLLNKTGAAIMQTFNVKAGTDITGFGLLGHALKMAQASGVSMHINSIEVPVLPGAYELAETGCIPGACFANQEFIVPHSTFAPQVDHSLRMVLCDAQTSGGLLMCVAPDNARNALLALKEQGCPHAAIIGHVKPFHPSSIFIA